jgi:hypothetical protein
VFTNGVGTAIKVFGSTASGTYLKNNAYNHICDLYPTDAAGVRQGEMAFSGGENFKLTSDPNDCVPSGESPQPGEIYNAVVMITYELSLGQITKTQVESGTLRGPYE